MDLTRRAMLNDFGFVQHAVLESPDHNTVHVIYGRDNRDFVHTKLTKVLETRTGLKLVPPQSPVAKPSSKEDSVIIAIVGRRDSLPNRSLFRNEDDLHPYRSLLRNKDGSLTDRSVLRNDDDSLTDRLLLEAVETAERPDSHTLFLQNGMHRPGWVGSKLPNSTLMLYPQSDVDRSQFWKTLTTLIG